MNFDSFIGLVANASMLLGLSVIHDTIVLRRSKHPLWQNTYIGILLGFIALALMTNPWHFGFDIIFDTRTILMSISGLFFGVVPTLIAVAMAVAYRIQMGGGGVYMGVLTILSSAAYGLFWRYLHQKKGWKYGFIELYGLGLLTHITMVALIFSLPKANQAAVFRDLTLPILIIYPFATVILGWLHKSHITRFENQKKLQESEEFIRSIANTAPPIWMAGLDMGCYWFNQSWLDFRGRTMEQEQSNGWIEGVHPEDLDHCLEVYTRSFENRQPFVMEYRLLRYDGKYRWIIDRGQPRYTLDGDFLGYVGSCIDNTELKITEEALRHTSEEFSAFFNASLDLFCIASMTGYFQRLNKQWTETLGYTLDELIEKPFMEFVHPDDVPLTMEVMEKLTHNQPITGYVNRYRHRDGSYRWIEWRSYPVNDRIFAAARDITDRIEREKEVMRLNRDLEDKVNARTAELQRANEELEAFTYSAAHDLKAPLRAISGFSKIITEDYEALLDEQGKHLLDRIQVNIAQMDQLITDLLTFAHISKQDLSINTIDMKRQAQSVFEELTTEDQRSKISLVIRDLPIGKADKKLLHQVWHNLLSNAVKFSEPVSHPQITISGYNTGFTNVFVVKDNGIGFDSRYNAEIFGLFCRVHTEGNFEGTGVGLAIVKRIIEKHDGKVWAESSIGNGTELYFSLPV